MLDGEFKEGGDVLAARSWLRTPIGGNLIATAGLHGARVWIKTEHLRFVNSTEIP